jgi:RNA polymerase sigma factor (sigma-70 family)
MSQAFGHQTASERDGRGEVEKAVGADLATVEAVAAIYHEGFHRFIRVAEAIAGNVDDAQDAVQDGFANALRQLDTYAGRGRLEGWVWRCVVNSARMSRRSGAGRTTPAGDLDGLIDVTRDRPEGPERLLPQLARLPERQRLVIFLRYFADLPYGAIADALQISPGTVAATLHAAQRSLRHWLQEVEE